MGDDADGGADGLQQLRHIFQQLDKDDSGLLRPDNFAAFLKKLDPEAWPAPEISRLFAEADCNGDGVVDLGDWAQFASEVDSGRNFCKQVMQAAAFFPRNVPGFRVELAGGEDAKLTSDLVADPAFHGGESHGLDAVQTYTAYAALGAREWKVNVAAVPCPAGRAIGRVALFMHGHGHSCCISTWGRFWAPMLARGYHLLAFDAPGFGRSAGASGQTLPWRDADAELVLLLLRSFGMSGRGRTTVFGQCMGGAMFLRALMVSPDTFGAWHVLHNCTIGSWPPQLADILRARGGGIQSFWWCDPDHMREANVYREFSALMARTPELCTFVDLQRDRELPAFFSFSHTEEPRLCRAERALVLGYCPEAVRSLADFASARPRAAAARGGDSAAPRKTMLQLGRENKDFKVFVRVRPPLPRERGSDPCCHVNDVEDPRGRIVQQIMVQRGDATGSSTAGSEFVFEHVFLPEASQDDVWSGVRSSLDAVGALLQGIGATIFAYGQTGSGKTFTIDGDGTGLTSRVVHDLYARLPPGGRVCCRYMQLYNEDFYDLFAPEVRLGQDSTNALLTAMPLRPATAQELLKSIRAGAALRASGRTDMNDSSSRSHAILCLEILEADVPPNALKPQLFIVDLAGSERVKRSGVAGTQLSEAVSINRSLFALGNVAAALVENDGRPRAHIPYRDSPLTSLLRNSLGGSARTALVACVSPASDSAEETLGTLKFAACATHVQNRTEQAALEAAENKAEEQLEREADAACGACAASVDFTSGEASIPTNAGNIHCFGSPGISSGGAPADSAWVVVLLHFYGPGVDGGMWRFMFGALEKAGHRYLAPDFPGHGASSGERGSSKPEDYCRPDGPVAVVLQVMNACGVKRAVLAGYDWGGGVACAFAAKYPARTSKLVAWCASVRDPRDMEKYQRRGKKGPALVLWAKSDLWHPFRKGTDLAAALGVKVVEVKVRADSKCDDVRARIIEFLRV
eukprot:CAMPEP_0170208234 /NCGR_PEP_ID=MMETSP0116_2-20130129/3700_1 /TAXON_ID=400756 /ORGANISM="Durinskia baltica, Strain CSIRO CS-38" /LENGTH=974 /DNA_ID=CAMNT_0010458703 /DNA_START=66 /DNA_END=2987 /DNA_ORIENTATION=+